MLEINFTNLHNQAHLFGNGAVTIDQEFSGNLLAIDVTTKPEYVVNSQVIGYLYQVYQSVSKGYAIKSGKDLIRLELPQSESLLFIPTSFLTDSYTLKIDYTSVGITALVDGSNTAAIPELILNLPSIVSGLQGDVFGLNVDIEGLQSAIASLALPSWNEIQGKPQSFPPSSHNHAIEEIEGLQEILNQISLGVTGLEQGLEANTGNFAEIDTDIAALNVRITTIENTPPVLSGGGGITLLASNILLESGKEYLATIANLVCTLPNSPSIGDVITLRTGDFPLRINHGNTSQQVLNNSTLSMAGALNGIILKANADITLVSLGANLWKSSYRARTTNNWIDSFTESVASIKPYSPTPLETYTYNAAGNNVNLITDGNKTNSGVMRSGGGTLGELRILLTFPYPTMLTSFNYWLGQFNGAFNMPTAVDVYIGATVAPANLKGAISLSGATGVRSLNTNTDFSTQYVFVFRLPNSGSISVLELEAVGRQIISGEIAVS
jgi:hypothetical protein